MIKSNALHIFEKIDFIFLGIYIVAIHAFIFSSLQEFVTTTLGSKIYNLQAYFFNQTIQSRSCILIMARDLSAGFNPQEDLNEDEMWDLVDADHHTGNSNRLCFVFLHLQNDELFSCFLLLPDLQ